MFIRMFIYVNVLLGWRETGNPQNPPWTTHLRMSVKVSYYQVPAILLFYRKNQSESLRATSLFLGSLIIERITEVKRTQPSLHAFLGPVKWSHVSYNATQATRLNKQHPFNERTPWILHLLPKFIFFAFMLAGVTILTPWDYVSLDYASLVVG